MRMTTASNDRATALAGIALAALAACSTAHAATSRNRSMLTAVGRGDCVQLPASAGQEVMRCPGIGGWRVVLEQSADRAFITLEPEHGRSGPPSSRHTLAPTNHVVAPDRPRATIEWRVSRPERAPVPYATIVRYITSRDGSRGEVLVVSKVGPGGACHVAYIDALANREAIVIAREIADRRARVHDCAKPPTVEGLSGRSPM